MGRSPFKFFERKDFFELIICLVLASLFVLLSSGAAFSQGNVGINNANPHARSLLDLTSTDKGLLVPRMTAAQRIAMFPSADATAKGMLVFQMDGAQGFYYYDGTAWLMLQSGANGWGLLGNTGTSAATNFLGTTDAQDLVIRTNNLERMRVTPNGLIGIGTNAPTNLLDLAAASATSRYTSSNSIWGGVIELKNTTPGTNMLGAVNFNDGANNYSGQIAYHPTDGMTIRSGGTERMRLMPNGTMGLGTTTPSCALDIQYPYAAQRITSTAATNGSVLELRNTNPGVHTLGAINFNDPANAYPGQLSYHPTSGMTFRSGGTEKMRITPNGSVGIGTTNPIATLHAEQPTAALLLTSTSTAFGSVIRLQTNTATGLLGQLNFVDNSYTARSSIYYYTNLGLGLRCGVGTGLTLDNSNNLGIKVMFPTADLEVNGFTKLASDAPAVKMKKYTGFLASTQGGSATVNHGLADAMKIIDVSIHVYNGAVSVPENYTVLAGSEFQYRITSTQIILTNVSGNSASILSMPFRILITYEQ
jgi:hypothetical protein